MVLERQDYINKAMDISVDRDTYQPLTADPANKHKNKLINMLRTIKAEGGLGDITYRRLHPSGVGLHISPSEPCHLHSQVQSGTGQSTTPRDIHVNTTHHNIV